MSGASLDLTAYLITPVAGKHYDPAVPGSCEAIARRCAEWLAHGRPYSLREYEPGRYFWKLTQPELLPGV